MNNHNAPTITEVLQQNIDQNITRLPDQEPINLDQFNVIPEHQGNLQALIERYGENPQACPFIRGLGESGIELVQKLAQVQKDPNRGPTNKELLAKKRQELRDKRSTAQNTTIPEKSKITPTESNPIILKSQLIVEKLKIPVLENSEPTLMTVEQTDTVSVNEKPILITEKPILKSIGRHTIIHETKNQEIIEIKKIESKIIVPENQTHQTISPIEENIPVSTLTSETFVVQRETLIDKDIESEQQLENDVLIPPVDNFEILDIVPTIESVPETVDIITPDSEIFEEEIIEMPEIITDEPDILTTFQTYIQSLEPIKAKKTELALKSIIEILTIQPNQLDNNPTEMNVLTEEIKTIVIELLQSFELNYDDQTIKILIDNLSTSEITPETTNQYLSQYQLNRLGTDEYLVPSTRSLLTNFLQLLKQKVQLHLQLGRFVLKANLS